MNLPDIHVSLQEVVVRAANARRYYAKAPPLGESYQGMVDNFMSAADTIISEFVKTGWVPKEQLVNVYGPGCVKLVRNLRHIEGRATDGPFATDFCHAEGFSLLKHWALGILNTTGLGKLPDLTRPAGPMRRQSFAEAVKKMQVYPEKKVPIGRFRRGHSPQVASYVPINVRPPTDRAKLTLLRASNGKAQPK